MSRAAGSFQQPGDSHRYTQKGWRGWGFELGELRSFCQFWDDARRFALLTRLILEGEDSRMFGKVSLALPSASALVLPCW
jgi:hypothetical protein